MKIVSATIASELVLHLFILCILCMQGPSSVWHCDGMDKLKPYGFAIHGCIDGYVGDVRI